jgi:DNA polymerase I-like protein with 3'-5' exonuclease and polymerase domains
MALYAGVELPGHPDPVNVAKLDRLPLRMIGDMQRFGFKIDPPHFAELSSRLQARQQALRKEIANEIPPKALDRFVEVLAATDNEDDDSDSDAVVDDSGLFNVESSKRVAELLYDTLRLDLTAGVKVKKTKGGDRLSTGKKTLEQLKRAHPVVPLILEYRECSKLDGTYARAMPRRAVLHPKGPDCPRCGRKHWEDEWRVHTQLLTTRTATGRTASKNPNLGNIPGRSALGREIRAGFIPSVGHVICQRDWAQIELRLMADRSGDSTMIEVYQADGDIHVRTAMGTFEISDPEKVDKLLHRAPSKNTNFAVCIAGGQKVLTDRGLIPIERVGYHDRVWDGQEFVFHQGVICQGFKEVIEYDGLTATPDHKVWLKDGTVSTLEGARSARRQLAHTEVGGIAIRFLETELGRNPPARPTSRKVHLRDMRGMWTYARSDVEQFVAEKNNELYLQENLSRSTLHNAFEEMAGHPSAMQQPKQRVVPKLWRTWHRVQVWLRERVSRLRFKETPTSFLQKSGHWQEEQRRPLREGQSTAGDPESELTQQALKSVRGVSRAFGYARGLVRPAETRLSRLQAQPNTHTQFGCSWGSVAGNTPKNPTETLEKEGKKYAWVFDILNAGPRRRFTVSGRLVSNCYLITGAGLLDLMASTFATAGQPMPDYMTERWCNDFIEKWFGLYPGVKKYLSSEEEKARRYGIVWTATGRVRRIPEARSCHPWIQDAGVRQGCNHGIQGYSADLMKLAMGELDERLASLREYGVQSFCLMSIYDELLVEAPEDDALTVSACMETVMDNVLLDRQTGSLLCKVPIKSDGSILTRWNKN